MKIKKLDIVALVGAAALTVNVAQAQFMQANTPPSGFDYQQQSQGQNYQRGYSSVEVQASTQPAYPQVQYLQQAPVRRSSERVTIAETGDMLIGPNGEVCDTSRFAETRTRDDYRSERREERHEENYDDGDDQPRPEPRPRPAPRPRPSPDGKTINEPKGS